MASASPSDDSSPAPIPNIDEAVGSTPDQQILSGPPPEPISGDPTGRVDTISTPTSVGTPNQNGTQAQATDVQSFADAVAADDRHAVGGTSASPADNTTGGTAPRTPTPVADQTSSTTAEPANLEGRSLNVLEQLIWECEPPAKVGALAHAGSLTDVRCGSADPAGLLTKLRGAFRDAELRDAGLLMVDDLGRDCLHSDLAMPTRIWLALRDTSNTAYEIVGESGGLRTGEPAVLTIQWDQTFRVAVKATGIAVIVFSMADMVLLRSLGVAAVIATDLARRPIDPAERVAVASDTSFLDKTNADCPDNGIQAVLIAACSITTDDLTEPPELAVVKDHFWLHASSLGCPHAEAVVWKPTPEDRVTLRWLISKGSVSGARTLIESAVDSAQPLIKPPPPRPPQTIAENLEAWVLANDLYTDLQSKLFRTLNKQNYDEFIAPMFREATNCSDLVEANLKHIFALRSCELQRRALKRVRDPQTVPGKADAAYEHQQLNDLLRVAKELKFFIKPPPSGPMTIILPGKATPHIPSYRRSDQS